MFAFLGTLLLSLCTIYAAFYLFYAYHKTYWKRRGIPSPKSEVFWGHAKELVRTDYLNVHQLRDWTRIFPRFYGIQRGYFNGLVISDPDLVHEVLTKKFDYFHGRDRHPLQEDPNKDPLAVNIITASGSHWKRLRSTANPLFSVSNLKKVIPTMSDSIDRILIHASAHKGDPFNIHPLFQELTMDVISRVALGQESSRIYENPYIDFAKSIFDSPEDNIVVTGTLRFPFIAPFVRKVLKLFRIGNSKVGMDFLAKLRAVVANRKQERQKGIRREKQDFIDMFLDVETEPQNYDRTMAAIDKSQMKVSKELDVNEIVGQCFIFLLAGYDTTANSLSLVCYELAKHPEVLQRLTEEIDQLPTDEDPNYEAIMSLPYLDAVVKESLRLYPIAANVVNRQCMETTEVGGIVIEQGTCVRIDVLSLNTSEKLWGPDPEAFRPERWLEGERPPPVAFQSFGGGPRICVGMRFAFLEEKLTLIKLIQRFHLTCTDQTEEKLLLKGASVFSPESVTLSLKQKSYLKSCCCES